MASKRDMLIVLETRYLARLERLDAQCKQRLTALEKEISIEQNAAREKGKDALAACVTRMAKFGLVLGDNVHTLAVKALPNSRLQELLKQKDALAYNHEYRKVGISGRREWVTTFETKEHKKLHADYQAMQERIMLEGVTKEFLAALEAFGKEQ